MLEEDKTRLQTTLNTIRTAGDNLNVRSNLTVDGSIRAKNIIIDDDDDSKLCLNTNLYPNLKKETILALLEQLIEKNTLDNKKDSFDIPVESNNKKIKTLTVVKDIDNYFKVDILISDGKMKVLTKHYQNGLKDLKFTYNSTKNVLTFNFKSKQNLEDFTVDFY